MKRLLVSVSILALVASPAMAWPKRGVSAGGGGGGGACPYGSSGVDGCPGNGGNFTQANFSTFARQSSQTWTSAHPWPWNAPGVDYPVGITTSVAAHTDPSLISVPGCQWVAHSGQNQILYAAVHGPAIECGNGTTGALTQNITLSGFDLSARFGHTCVFVYIGNAAGFNVTFDNLFFENDSTCLNAGNGTTLNTAMMFGATGGSKPGSVTLRNSEFLFHGADSAGWAPGANSDPSGFQPGTGPAVLSFTVLNSSLIEYNHFDHIPGQTQSITGNGTCPNGVPSPVVNSVSIVIRYNYLDTNHNRGPMGHGAFGSLSCYGSDAGYYYNTMLWSNANLENNFTTLMSATPNSTANGVFNVKNNVVVGNALTGETPADVSNTISGTFNFTVVGPTITVNSISWNDSLTHPIALGQALGPMLLWRNTGGGSGAGSTWTYDCGQQSPGAPGTINYETCFPGGTGLGYYNVDQTIAPGLGAGHPNPATYTTTQNGGIGNYVVANVHGSFIGPNTITDNYIDDSGVVHKEALYDVSASSCDNVSVISGNINLRTGATMSGKLSVGSTGC